MDEKTNNIIKNSIMQIKKVTGKPLKFQRYFNIQE